MFIPAADAVVAHRYRLLEEIGRGGMGAIWRAVDTELDAPCALKFILDQRDKPKQARARFLREAQAAARLQSPHVVSVRSVGEWDEALYIAMELLTGETLAQRLRRLKLLTPAQTLQLVQQVALVLNMSHHANIVHRDLKPANIWLWSGADVFVKVLDFGVAKHLNAGGALTNTHSGMLVGTPHYMSPEQAAGDRHVDHRADLWALAVIAVECLSGQRPFDSAGLGQLLSNVINRRSRPLAELYPATTPALEAWWQRATSADPSARYGSAEALARNLALALELERAPSLAPTKLTATKLTATKLKQKSSTKNPAQSTPKPEQVATVEPASGFDVWRNPSTKTTSGQPVTTDIVSIPMNGLVVTKPLKVIAGFGTLVVVGVLGQFAWQAYSPAASPTVAIGAASANPNEQRPNGSMSHHPTAAADDAFAPRAARLTTESSTSLAASAASSTAPRTARATSAASISGTSIAQAPSKDRARPVTPAPSPVASPASTPLPEGASVTPLMRAVPAAKESTPQRPVDPRIGF